VLVLHRVLEPGPREAALDRRQPAGQLVEIGDDEAHVAAQHLGVAGRQVELLLPDVDPHVVERRHQVRVPGQAEAHDVEHRGDLLVGDLHVDVLERDDVADVLAGPVVSLACHADLRRSGLASRDAQA
jgi:hypothetical protein